MQVPEESGQDKESRDVIKQDLRQTSTLAALPKKGPQLESEIQPVVPIDDPKDETRESLQSLKSTIKTLGHTKMSGPNAMRVLHSIGMLCEALQLGESLWDFFYSKLQGITVVPSTTQKL